MQEPTRHAFNRALRLAQAPREGLTQELPRSAAVVARIARRAHDAHFASLNAAEGVAIAAHARPQGVIWRLHPAPTAGAGLAQQAIGAHP
jgi:hypothetical protein